MKRLLCKLLKCCGRSDRVEQIVCDHCIMLYARQLNAVPFEHVCGRFRIEEDLRNRSVLQNRLECSEYAFRRQPRVKQRLSHCRNERRLLVKGKRDPV